MANVEFLPRAVVEAKLAARGSKITAVVFAKKNGDVTRRVGMPKVYTRRVGGEKGPAATLESVKRADIAAQALAAHGNIFFDYADPSQHEGKTGFAFNIDRVVHI